MSAPAPFSFLRTLDFGFGTWIRDLDLGLGFRTGLGLDNYFLWPNVRLIMNSARIV